MAEKLIFPVGFDLDAAVKEAADAWASKYQAQLEKAIQKKPLNVRVGFDAKQLNNLEAVQKRLAEVKLMPITPETREAIKSLVRELKNLETILKRIDRLNAANARSTASASAATALAAQRTARANEINARAAARAQQDAEKLAILEERKKRAIISTAEAERRRAEAANRTTAAYKAQEGYISRLMKRTAILFSIGTVMNFARQLREVTAEFELQRVSLGAIIQDTQKANELFSRIKTFAVQSPFEIKDLVSYVKQLSAYRIATEDLFDTTKRLADVSAGLGVDMQRIILAYGQVRAASVLRGQEVRQFTEAGIPLVELLAEKFSKLRGEMVSTGEVFDLISQRAVSFEMVKEIFEDMTNAGGMFYNMQEKQSKTLAGQWSNMKDAYSIMLDEMGKTTILRGTMEGLISLAKTLMENWKSVYNVINTSLGAVTAMVVVYKNAKTAATALTLAEAKLFAVKNRQIAQAPGLIKLIIGERKARLLSIATARLHTAALIKQVRATNILTKAFWRLTAAMLSNPYIAIVGIITALGIAIFKLSTRTETAEDRIKKLNNAVGAMEQHKNSVQPLIESYEELSNKLNRTAEEEKKLQSVTKELANKYPGAVKSVKNFGEGVEFLSDKLRELNQAEQNARREVTEAELKETEKKIEEYEKKITGLDEQLSSGMKKRLVRSDVFTTEIVEPLTDKDKKRILEEIEELRAGSNGEGGLNGLRIAADNARRALGLIPEEAKAAIEQFGSWKKTLSEVNREISTLDGKRTVRLFDDTTINNFSTLNDALQEIAKKYKENETLAKSYKDVLASESINESERKDIENKKAQAEVIMEMTKATLEYYNALSLLEDKTTTDDKRLENLKEQISLLKKIYANYKEYTKFENESDAQERINRQFQETLDILKQYGVELPKTSEEYKEALRKLQAVMRTLPKSRKDVLELGYDIEAIDFNDQKLQFEKEIKRLGDEVSKTKTAKDFFQNMLNLTGDKDLSATITMSVYGDTGDDLAKNMVKQVEAAFKGVDISSAIGKDGFIDYLQLEDMLDKVPEEYREAARKIVEEGKKSNADIMKTFLNVMTNYDGIAQQRINIEQEAARKTAQIQEGLAIYLNQLEKERTKVGEEETNKRIAEAQERANEAEASVDSEKNLGLLKLKDNYIRFFGAIHTMTEKEATTLRNDLRQALFDAFQKGALSADELRRELKTVDEQFDKLINDVGFFGTYMLRGIDGLIQRIRDLADETVEVAGEISKMSNPDQITDAQKSFIDDILKRFGNSDTGKSFKELFDKAGGDTKKMAENLQKVIESMGNIASKGTGLLSVFDTIIQAIGSTVSGIGEIRDLLNSVRSEEMDNGFWRAFEYIEAYNNSMQEFWQRLKSGDIIGAAFSIGKFFVSIFTIRHQKKVKKLNKEIEKQEKIIHDLDRAYQKLEKSAEKLFGDAFLNNYEQQQKNLQAQIEATQKQLDAENEKGKSKDKEKVQEYEDALDDLQQKSDELRESLGEHFLGESLESAARTFADSWLEAYEQFGDTRKALEDSMHDMMMNLIKETVFGAVMKKALEPLYEYLETLDAGDFALQETWDTIGEQMEDVIDVADIGAKNAADLMEKWGVLSREMGGDLTGISKDIATASEESILGLAAGINTQNFYISGIYTTVMQMYAIMRGGTIDETTTGISLTDLITLQNQYLSSLPTIAQNTAEIITRAERAAIACEDIATNINRIVKPTGVKGSYTLKAEIQ